MSLVKRYRCLKRSIQQGVPAGEQVPELLVVGKKQPLAEIAQLAEEGQLHFGESQVQEAVIKIQALPQQSLVWHMIGHVQSNKARLVSQNFDWVQSVDSFRLAEKLNEYRKLCSAPLNICLQVNVDQSKKKQGVAMEDVVSLADAIKPLTHLRVRGLMAIFDPASAVQTQKKFSQLAQLYQHYKNNYGWDTLSMGMSQDFQDAIAAGSTMVRIGRGLFGDHPLK